MALSLGDIDACIQDLIDLTEDYKELEVMLILRTFYRM